MSIKKFFSLVWYALPVQLFLLHFRKHQELLLLWYILLSTVTGHFLSNFGADSLFLTPEYFGSTNFLSTSIVGFAFGLFFTCPQYSLPGNYGATLFEVLYQQCHPSLAIPHHLCIKNGCLCCHQQSLYFHFCFGYAGRTHRRMRHRSRYFLCLFFQR